MFKKVLIAIVLLFIIVLSYLFMNEYIGKHKNCDGEIAYTVLKGESYYEIAFPFKFVKFCGVLKTKKENGLVHINEVQNGKFHGIGKVFYKDGQKFIQASFKNNQYDGLMIAWAPNGQKISEMYFIEGLEEGEVQQWYANGGKKMIGKYHKGKKNGIFKTWDKTGKSISELKYINGENNAIK